MESYMIIMIVVGLGGIAFAVWFFSKDQRIKRALKKAPRLTVSNYHGGTEAKLVGRVRLLNELASPLTGRPCAHYQVKVDEHRSSGKSSHWHNIIKEERSVTFELDDGTGRAIVEAENGQIVVVKDAHFRSGTFNDATPLLENVLSRHGCRSTGLFGLNKGLRYNEGVIEQGEVVAVFGRGVWKKDASGTRRLFMIQPQEGHLLVSDDPSTL